MEKLILTVLILISNIFGTAIGQEYEEYDVDEFFNKIDLDYGSLDENGNSIDFIFVKTELNAGNYEVDITDGPGDLYEIKGTKTFIKFRSYYGYAGYGDEGILVVGGSSYMSTFYKKEN